MPTEIPQLPSWPLVGNLLELSEQDFVARTAAQYGPIFKVSLGAGKPLRIYVCSAELLNEICNEKLFAKNPNVGGLSQVRNLTGDGLFTAFHGEENWSLAHRILMPALGPMSIGGMFEDMHEIACQLVLKWARLGQTTGIPVAEDFTRLTLDTLALCTMDTRFNSFYSKRAHPFVTAMVAFLKESGSRAFLPSFVSDHFYRKRTQSYFQNIELMRNIAKEVVERRRAATARTRDLVDAMIHDRDPETGKGLSEPTIINNMITFLIAGHETTSGLLSFLIYCLVKNPIELEKARKEISTVLGDGPMTSPMASKLPYVMAIIRETLRLYPTAPGFSVQPISRRQEDYPIYIGQKQYAIQQGETLVASLAQIHKDPKVYNEDAAKFRPVRMLDSNFKNLPKNSWKPFGNGARGCIGRAFALQESTIVIALLLQNFDFEMDDPEYQLAVSKNLTIKPKNFFVRATLRDGLSPATLQRRLFGGNAPSVPRNLQGQGITRATEPSNMNVQELLICYGSNTGTCQMLAHTLAQDTRFHGFRPKISTMDEATDRLSLQVPTIIITASYEGCPPTNATKFVKWLSRLTDSPFVGFSHAVFGCGNRDWVDTFQSVPTLVNDALNRCGSTPLVARGISDAADSNIGNEFDEWADKLLWPALETRYCAAPLQMNDVAADYTVRQSNRTQGLLSGGVQATVQQAAILTAAREPEKRHLKIRLPEGTSYAIGDYLAILPLNHDIKVKEVMTRFELAIDSKLVGGNASERSTYTFLREYVELNQIATEKNVRAISRSIPEAANREKLDCISTSTITEERMSVLDLLQRFPSAAISFPEYLAMLPPLRARQYSISSSPLVEQNTCTLTYSVIDKIKHGVGHDRRRFLGVASNYLASLQPNDRLWVAVSPGHRAFHLAEHPPDVPIIMVCTGSGLAPFRGWVQERAKQIEQGRSPAKAVLFIGCRHPERDVLYGAELRDWAAQGAVELRYAFSQKPEESQGCRYVQDRLREDGDALIAFVKGEGKMFVCGSSKVVEGVGKVVAQAYAEEERTSLEEAERWSRGIRNDRFASDVFD